MVDMLPYYADAVYHLPKPGNILVRSLVPFYQMYSQRSIEFTPDAKLQVVMSFLIAIPTFCITHYRHHLYLEYLGFSNGGERSQLIDNGSLVWGPNVYGIRVGRKCDINVLKKNAMNNKSGLIGNISKNPVHLAISSDALSLIWSILKSLKVEFSHSIFLDFGSGTGMAMLSAMTKPFKEVIGIERDSASVEICRANINKMKGTKPSEVKASIIRVINEDIRQCSLDLVLLRSDRPQDIVVVVYM